MQKGSLLQGGQPSLTTPPARRSQAREQRLRSPELVARYGSEVLRAHRRRLGVDEGERVRTAAVGYAYGARQCLPPACGPRSSCSAAPHPGPPADGAGNAAPCAVWALHEQVAVAALDVGNLPLALSLVQGVHRQFPTGSRGSRLTVGGRVGGWWQVPRGEQAGRWQRGLGAA